MKKVVIISMLIAGTFASVGTASAADLFLGNYNSWAVDAFDNGER